MAYNFFVLIPPILVLVLAIWTRNVIASLLIGIITAALLVTNFSPIKTIMFAALKIFEETNISGLFGYGPIDHIYTFGFLLILGILITLITHTGGIAAYSAILKQKLKNKKRSEMASLFLSPIFFLDDYLSNLTVGCIIKPITDQFKVPRAKLAYLLDTMSSPLCAIIPASSWTALILSQLKVSGVTETLSKDTLILADPLMVYLKSIPYIIYSFLVVLSTWFIIKFGVSYGPMNKHELIAEETGNLFAGKNPTVSTLKECGAAGSLGNFFVPIGVFLSSLILILFYSGYKATDNPTIFNILLSANPFLALFWAAVIALIASFIYLFYKRTINTENVKDIVFSGIKLMQSSLLVLLLAWTFAAILKDNLETGQYLAHLLINHLPEFTLPLMIFLSSMIIAASTGSSWGTIAIVLPLSIPAVTVTPSGMLPLTPEQTPLLYPIIGALISGSLAGTNISLISDSTIMASTSSGAYAIDHLITQIFYVAPAIFFTALGYVINGILFKSNSLIFQIIISIVLLVLTLVTISFLNRIFKHKSHSGKNA